MIPLSRHPGQHLNTPTLGILRTMEFSIDEMRFLEQMTDHFVKMGKFFHFTLMAGHLGELGMVEEMVLQAMTNRIMEVRDACVPCWECQKDVRKEKGKHLCCLCQSCGVKKALAGLPELWDMVSGGFAFVINRCSIIDRWADVNFYTVGLGVPS